MQMRHRGRNVHATPNPAPLEDEAGPPQAALSSRGLRQSAEEADAARSPLSFASFARVTLGREPRARSRARMSCVKPRGTRVGGYHKRRGSTSAPCTARMGAGWRRDAARCGTVVGTRMEAGRGALRPTLDAAR